MSSENHYDYSVFATCRCYGALEGTWWGGLLLLGIQIFLPYHVPSWAPYRCACSDRSAHRHMSHDVDDFSTILSALNKIGAPVDLRMDPSVSHQRHRCILSLSLCTNT